MADPISLNEKRPSLKNNKQFTHSLNIPTISSILSTPHVMASMLDRAPQAVEGPQNNYILLISKVTSNIIKFHILFRY